jgi:hypothetical protein
MTCIIEQKGNNGIWTNHDYVAYPDRRTALRELAAKEGFEPLGPEGNHCVFRAGGKKYRLRNLRDHGREYTEEELLEE